MNLVIESGSSAFNGVMDTILDNGKVPVDATGLKQQESALRDEIREFMLNGDAAGVVRVQNLLRDLPIRIKAAEIKEIRENIDKANQRLEEIKIETKLVEGVRGEKNKILAEKLKTVEEAGVDVRRVEFILYQLDNDAENQRQARREYTSQLNILVASADA
jgi:iron only hydrogenase large subunit-like protein